MPATIHEPAKTIPVLDEVDVLVAGGGVSGVAAATSAARAGARTLLVERMGYLGGVATAALMTSMCNRMMSGDGRQAVRGFPEELFDRMVAHGATMPAWRSRALPQLAFEEEGLRLALVELLHDSGAQTLVETWVTDVIVRDGALVGVVTESKGGRQAILCKTAVDASGDADLAAWAGAPYRNAPPDSGSPLFTMSNVDLEQTVRYFEAHPSEWQMYCDQVTTLEDFAANWRERGMFHLPHGGSRHMTIVKEAIAHGEYVRDLGMCKDLDIFGMFAFRGSGTCMINSCNFRIDHLDPCAHARAELEARRAIPMIAEFVRAHFPGFEHARVAESAAMVGVRYTRWIDAGFDLTREHVSNGARFDDCIGVFAAFRPHPQGGSIYPPYTADLPYRIMLPQRVENLLVCSGKNVSSTPRGLVRGMIQCQVLGQGAGVAAALSALKGVTPRSVPIREVQRTLLAQNVNLGDEARLKELGLV